MERKLAPNAQLNKIVSGMSRMYATDPQELDKYLDGIAEVYATGSNQLYNLTQFQNVITYFAGEFDEITNNKEFKKIRMKFWKCAFFFGEAYVYVGEKGKMQVFSKIEGNKYQVFEDASRTYTFNENQLAKFEVPLFNVFLQWMELFKREDQLVSIWYLNALVDAKKFKALLNSTDEEQLLRLERDFFNPRKPFIYEYTCLNSQVKDTPNTIQPLELPPSTTHLTFDNIIDHFNFFGDRLGYAVSRENKKERLTSGENFINVHNTNNILRMFVNQLDVFCDELEEYFGIKLEFTKQEDLEEPLASTAPGKEGEQQDV